jgi:hypothetical protein
VAAPSGMIKNFWNSHVMVPTALADDFGSLHVQGRSQRRGRVAGVIMRRAFGLARPHRHERLGAVQGMVLTLLVRAQGQRPIRRVEMQPHDLARLCDEGRIFRALNVLTRCGNRVKTRQVRRAIVSLSLQAWALARVLQCVAFRGDCSKVRAITASACAPVMCGEFHRAARPAVTA